MRWFGGVALAALLAQPAAADSIDDAAAKFGARPSVSRLGISPDGAKVLVLGSRREGGDNAVVIDLATSHSVAVLSLAGGRERISNCSFVTTDRVVCQMFLMHGTGIGTEAATRLVTISADGTDAKLLTARPRSTAFFRPNYGGDIVDHNVEGDARSVLMASYISPEQQTGTLNSRSGEGLAVEAVDVYSLRRRMVERPHATAIDYVTDGQGHVRLMALQAANESGYAKNVLNYQIRPSAGGGWRPLSVVAIDAGTSTGFEPVAVEPGTDTVYGFDEYNGNVALFRLVDASLTKPEVLVSTPDGDVDSLVRLGRGQRVVGASWVGEKRQVRYFDADLSKLSQSLSGALPGHPGVAFVSASADEKKLVVFASSDVDPGTYYLYDRDTRKLGQLLAARAELAGTALAPMKPISFPAADGTMIPGYLTLPPGSDGRNLPAIVMPHGGPAARDEWGFDWLVQYFATQGYAVLQPNYRGSAGYGSKWFQQNGFRSWRTAIGDVNDAGRWLLAQGIASKGKLAIFGWSYGGYAALQSAVVDPDLYKAIVAVAPVTDLDRVKDEARDQSNYRLVENFVGSGPHVEAGSPARHADRIAAPVMLFHGDMDTNVAVAESRLMADRLKAAGHPALYTEFKGLDHQLDDAQARRKLLSESDRFLRKALGIN
jgi:dipeptidyl aminopeptidase/acylaminoacyl peptidase